MKRKLGNASKKRKKVKSEWKVTEIHNKGSEEVKPETELQNNDFSCNSYEEPRTKVVTSFVSHFGSNIANYEAKQIVEENNWTSEFVTFNELGRTKVSLPTKVKLKEIENKCILLKDEYPLPPPAVAICPNTQMKSDNLHSYNISRRLQGNLHLCDGTNNDTISRLDDLQLELLYLLGNYYDLYYPEANYKKWNRICAVYCLHAVKHILDSQWNVSENDKLIKKTGQSVGDRGFTAAKVLMILPFKHFAYRVINTISKLLFGEEFWKHVKSGRKFEEEFSPGESKMGRKTGEYRNIFAGDIGEDFIFGVKFMKKEIKIFEPLSSSDLLICSPFGLRYKIMENLKPRTSFLSSIEVLIMDQADIFLMQNWEHMLVIFDSLNLMPSKLSNLQTELTRIRPWIVEGLSAIHRQTILFASTLIDINRAVFNKCRNFAGQLEVLNLIDQGKLHDIKVTCQLLMHIIKDGHDPKNSSDTHLRFKFFSETVLSHLLTLHKNKMLFYIPNYCDYLRLQRHFKEERGCEVACVDEFMTKADAFSNLIKFKHGSVDALLITERYHFYHRRKIRGFHHLVFYQLPSYPSFVPQIANYMKLNTTQPLLTEPIPSEASVTNTITVVADGTDVSRLCALLGSQRTANILASNKKVHMCHISAE